VPAGWAKSPDGDKTDYRDPTGQLLVQLQRVTFPITTAQGPSTPVGYDVNKMLQREQATKAEYANYHLISLGQTDLGQVDPVPGAEWVFTFVSNGTTRMVTVLGTHRAPTTSSRSTCPGHCSIRRSPRPWPTRSTISKPSGDSALEHLPDGGNQLLTGRLKHDVQLRCRADHGAVRPGDALGGAIRRISSAAVARISPPRPHDRFESSMTTNRPVRSNDRASPFQSNG